MSKTEIELNEGERLDPLGGGLKIIVSKEHIFGTDAVLLASFSDIRKNDTACDLGTGCGIIPLLWCKKETGKLFAVEIQKRRVSSLNARLFSIIFQKESALSIMTFGSLKEFFRSVRLTL